MPPQLVLAPIQVLAQVVHVDKKFGAPAQHVPKFLSSVRFGPGCFVPGLRQGMPTEETFLKCKVVVFRDVRERAVDLLSLVGGLIAFAYFAFGKEVRASQVLEACCQNIVPHFLASGRGHPSFFPNRGDRRGDCFEASNGHVPVCGPRVPILRSAMCTVFVAYVAEATAEAVLFGDEIDKGRRNGCAAEVGDAEISGLCNVCGARRRHIRRRRHGVGVGSCGFTRRVGACR